MSIALAEILVHAIVGDKPGCRRAIALGVKKPGIVSHAGQQRRSTLHSIFLGQSKSGERGAVFGIVLPRPFERILQGQSQGSTGCSLIVAAAYHYLIGRVLGRRSQRQGDRSEQCGSPDCRAIGEKKETRPWHIRFSTG